MQNLNKYISIFNQEYKGNLVNGANPFMKRLNKFLKVQERFSIKYTDYDSTLFIHPYQESLSDSDYEIIKNISKLLKVKAMWKYSLNHYHQETKTILFIGEKDRTIVANAILVSWFNYKHSLDLYIKKNLRDYAKVMGYKSIRSCSRDFYLLKEAYIIKYIKDKLEHDINAEVILEKYIKIYYRLDYKNYNTDTPEYYHAISRKFYNRRMLL